jgi:hypothetical protein
VISHDQAALNPLRAAAWAALARSDFPILAIVCSRFRVDIGSRSRFQMPSLHPFMNAMSEVNKELETHFTHLSNPELDVVDRETIGIFAAEGVRRGFTVMALHQRFFNLMLDELEQEALALQK